MSRAWTETILEAAYQRGWLLRSVQEKLRFLIEGGLHVEQALLGTGLLTVSQYVELIQGAFGLTLGRLDQDRFTRAASKAELPDGVERATDEDGKAFLLVSDGWRWQDERWFKDKAPKLFVLRSDILRWKRTAGPVDLAVSPWWEALSKHRATEARIALERGKGEVWIGADAKASPGLELDREELPALQAWFEAGYPQREWRAKRLPGTESDVLEATHLANAHPLERLNVWRAFLSRPQGVMVCVAPDAWLEREIEHLPEPQAHAEHWTIGSLVRVRPQTEHDREVAWHAALSGAAICWIEDVPQELDWMRSLAQAGISVHVVRSRHTPHGTAWEGYRV